MPESDPVVLCALLWAQDGCAADLAAYEDRVLALLPDHGAELLHRARSVRSSESSDVDGPPLEVQLFRFPSQDAVATYLADERRTSLTAERDRVVARTELMPVAIV